MKLSQFGLSASDSAPLVGIIAAAATLFFVPPVTSSLALTLLTALSMLAVRGSFHACIITSSSHFESIGSIVL